MRGLNVSEGYWTTPSRLYHSLWCLWDKSCLTLPAETVFEENKKCGGGETPAEHLTVWDLLLVE